MRVGDQAAGTSALVPPGLLAPRALARTLSGAVPRSTLTEAGRGGLPQDPDATIPALYLAGRDAEPALPTATNPTTPRVTHQGSLRLTMHCDGWSGP